MTKLCKDCEHFQEGDPMTAATCQHWAATIPDLVHGTKPIQYSCEGARTWPHVCGPDGVLYEPKENRA